jgi:hypothetical protein
MLSGCWRTDGTAGAATWAPACCRPCADCAVRRSCSACGREAAHAGYCGLVATSSTHYLMTTPAHIFVLQHPQKFNSCSSKTSASARQCLHCTAHLALQGISALVVPRLCRGMPDVSSSPPMQEVQACCKPANGHSDVLDALSLQSWHSLGAEGRTRCGRASCASLRAC